MHQNIYNPIIGQTIEIVELKYLCKVVKILPKGIWAMAPRLDNEHTMEDIEYLSKIELKQFYINYFLYAKYEIRILDKIKL